MSPYVCKLYILYIIASERGRKRIDEREIRCAPVRKREREREIVVEAGYRPYMTEGTDAGERERNKGVKRERNYPIPEVTAWKIDEF